MAFVAAPNNVNNRFTLIKGSIADRPLVDSLFAIHKFDVVVNLAAQAGVRYSIDHEIEHELHWRLNGAPEGHIGDQVETYLQDIYASARTVDTLAGSFAIPSDFHNGIIALLHMAKHMTKGGMGLRHLCDWAVLVDTIDDFEGTFKTCFTALGIWRFACLMTAVCVRYLGLKEQAWASEMGFAEDLIEDTLQDILGAGNFGRAKTEIYSRHFLGNVTVDGNTKSHGMVGNMVRSLSYRSYESLPITKKHPILLPFGLLYLFIRYFVRVIRGKRKLLNPVKTISEAKEREHLYAQFRLFEQE